MNRELNNGRATSRYGPALFVLALELEMNVPMSMPVVHPDQMQLALILSSSCAKIIHMNRTDRALQTPINSLG